MKKSFRLLAMVLCVALCLTFVPSFEVKAQAANIASSTDDVLTILNGLKGKFNGKYWNYYDRREWDSRRNDVQSKLKASVDNGDVFASNPSNAALGVTNSACSGPLFESGCRSNYFSGGWQCYGFAWYIEYVLFRSTYEFNSSDWNVYSGNSLNSISLQPGDLVRVNGHSIVVGDVSGGKLNCVEAWGGSGCKISWSPGFNWSDYTTTASMLSATKSNGGAVYRYKAMEPDEFPFSRYAYECSTYRIVQATNLKTKPYAASPDKDGVHYNVGDIIHAREIMINKYDNLWLLTDAGGYVDIDYGSVNGVLEQRGDQIVEYVADEGHVWVEDPVVPRGDIVADANFKANGFNIGGTVKSYNSIKKITASISAPDVSDSTITYSDRTTVSQGIYNSNLNYNLRFNDLQPGTYEYKLRVTYYSNFLQKEVTVEPAECVSTFTVVDPNHSTHNWSQSTVVAPTCTEGGYTRYTCSGCALYEDRNPTAALGHDYVETNRIEASCLVDGQIQYTCSRCGDMQTEVLPASGHSFSAPVRFAADCTNLGGTIQECTKCHETKIVYDEPEWSAWSPEYPEGIPESLTETGEELRYYTKETIVINRGETPPAGSTYLSSNSGWTDYGDWGNWQTDSISANDATQVETRTQYAYCYFRCPNCGKHHHGYGQCWSWSGGGCGAKTTADDFVVHWSTTPFSSVSFKEWNGTTHYYAYVDGELVFRWDDNSHTRTQYRSRTRTLLDQEVYELAPQWSDWAMYAEGTVPAGENIVTETRPVYRYYSTPGEHVWDEGTISTTPTCTHEGVRTYTCTVCNQTKTESIAVVPHSYENEVVAPTCTVGGYTKHTCAECGHYFEDSATDPTGHNWGNEEMIRPATCGVTGYSKFTCSVCGETKLEETPGLEHDYQTYKVEPTCVQNGFTKEMCVQCGDCKSEVVIQALGHSEVTVPGHAATCTSSGVTDEVRCERCDEVLVASEPIPALGHSYTETIVEPTPTEDGYTLHTCEICGDSFIDNPVPYVEPDGFKVIVETKKARAGQTVELKIMLEENPGIWGMSLSVAYDKSLLALTEVVNGTVYSDAECTSGNLAISPYVLFYRPKDLSNNNNSNGLLATMKFAVNEGADADSHIPVTLSYKQGDIIDVDLNDIMPTMVPGGIDVISFVYGDLNSDGTVNMKDSLLMCRYLAGWSIVIDTNAADVYTDDTVNQKDVLILDRYLAGWTVTLGK